jgi:hypothetical protein
MAETFDTSATCSFWLCVFIGSRSGRNADTVAVAILHSRLVVCMGSLRRLFTSDLA